MLDRSRVFIYLSNSVPNSRTGKLLVFTEKKKEQEENREAPRSSLDNYCNDLNLAERGSEGSMVVNIDSNKIQ